MTYNKVNTYPYFRERVYKVEDTDHDASDFHAAMDKALEWGDQIPIGQIYRNPDPPPSIDLLDPALQAGPLVGQPYAISVETRNELISEFM